MTPGAKRAAIYVRVSTGAQSLRPQFAALRELCSGRGWPVVAVYRDRASGVKDRKGLRRCLHDASMRRFDVLVVWALDRFGRTTLEVLARIEQLQARGVAFVSAREATIDTSTASGALILSVMAAVATFERGRLVERTKEALADRKRRGVRLGRPAKTVDVETARARIASGEALAAVARSLGLSPRTLRRKLKV